MEWHLSKQGNILAVAPERGGLCVCVRVCEIVCVQTGWMSLGAPQTDRQTDSKLIKQSGSQSVMQLFIQFAAKFVSW